MARAPLTRWQLQEAKNRFSELVDEAQRNGPQVVTRRGTDSAVVLSYAEYQRLTGQRGASIRDLLLAAPKVPSGLRLERSQDRDRELDIG